MNAVDPEIAAKIYDHIQYDGRTLKGVDAARILIANQLKGIQMAAGAGMLVKVNCVMIPGINAGHIPEVAKKAKDMGAYIVNILPLIPVPGTKFGNMRAPTARERKELQDLCEVDVKQMRHCRQCRADAIGLLGEDRSAEFAHFTCGERKKDETGPIMLEMEGSKKYRIAVATTNGIEVNAHFGHAEEFSVFEIDGEDITLVDKINVAEVQEIPALRTRTSYQDGKDRGASKRL